ncbi:MAG: tetratricopeptide repeat protein [Bacteroidales bacterium]|nr:tetratricopeptide repeat protein [Bacteroidales bacterium]
MNRNLFKFILVVFIFLYPFNIKSINNNNSGNDSTNIANKLGLIDNNIQIISKNYHIKSDSILKLAKHTLELSIENNYQNGINQSYFYIARMFDIQNIKDSAIYYYESGLEEEFTDINMKADFLRYLTGAYRFIGNYSASLKNCLLLKDFVESGKTTKYSYQIYNLLALSYKALMEYDLAFQNFEKSAQLALENDNEAFAGVVYANIGNLFYEQNRLKEALEYFAKGIILEEKHGLYGNAGNSYTVIANIYLKLEKSDSSFLYLQKADNYNTKYNNDVGLAYTHFTFGKYYFQKGDYETSIDYLKRTIDYASKNHLNVLLSDSYKLMSEINAIQGNFKDAYKNFDNFYKIYIDIYDVEKINKAKAIEQRLIQQKKENELFELELKKQKTINTLLIIIVSLSLVVGIVILIYLFQFKKLNKEHIKSKERAEESDKLKSKFLQTISHEIRTPLNGILGFSEMILSKSLSDKELSEVNDLIIQNSDNLISTIENLVDIAHLSTNQYNIKKSKFELTPLLESIIFQAKKNVVLKNKADLDIQLKKNGEIELFTDKTIILKIILHLVKNAILYTEKGSITIGYKEEKSNIILYVKDTGIGIPKEKIDIIFSPFRQADEDINIKVGGTGLGLSIVNKFVQLLDGNIWVGSKLNEGSTFFLSLPLK